MASTYSRADSPFIWIRYKSDSGVWKSANTGYRQDNLGDQKQAELLAKRKSLEEMANKPVQGASRRWEDYRRQEDPASNSQHRQTSPVSERNGFPLRKLESNADAEDAR